jgi:polyisoprenoid-binding protein YceI
MLVLVPVAAVVAVVAVVGGTWLYINVVRGDPPARLTLDVADQPPAPTAPGSSPTTGSPPGAAELAGTWSIVQDGTQAGYRVPEVLFGQKTEAVARTSEVTGSMTFDGTAVTAADFSVDMASVASVPPESRRDGQFRGRIMDVASFPTATFRLAEPVAVEAVPASGQRLSAQAVGDLTLRGRTRRVTIPLQAQLDGDRIQVLGDYEVVFDDWGIPSPSFGPASVGDTGTLELLLVLVRG